MSKIAMARLAKQRPVTLEEARTQVIRIKIWSKNMNKEREVKYLLAMYHPDWTQEQIDAESKRLMAEK